MLRRFPIKHRAVAVAGALISLPLLAGPNQKVIEDNPHDAYARQTFSSYDLTWSEDPGRPRSLVDLQKLYAVFRQTDHETETPSQGLSSSAGVRAADGADRYDDHDDMSPGNQGKRQEPTQRLIMQDLFETGDRLYAEPEGTGDVALSFMPHGAGVKGTPEPHGLLYQILFTPPHSMFVYGMVGDDVAGVEIVAAGRTIPAKMAKNAFALEVIVETDLVKPEQLLLRAQLRDGGLQDYESVRDRFELAVDSDDQEDPDD